MNLKFSPGIFSLLETKNSEYKLSVFLENCIHITSYTSRQPVTKKKKVEENAMQVEAKFALVRDSEVRTTYCKYQTRSAMKTFYTVTVKCHSRPLRNTVNAKSTVSLSLSLSFTV